MNQVLLIDKPAGWTSFDVVAKIRSALRKTNDQEPTTNDSRAKVRVGHAGTLDPFATGLLIILIGTATKEQDKYMKQDKEYLATLRLGYNSTTGDPEGTISQLPIDQNTNLQLPKRDAIEKVVKKFTGEIEQTPPVFSAIKVEGKRAYKLARAGKKVELEPRKINIYELEVVSYNYPELKIRVKCSSGTYIRTLGEDIGKALNCGAYLTDLRRTKIGNYSVDNALTVEKFVASLEPKT